MWRAVVAAAIVLASAPASARERSARLVYMGAACSEADLVTQMIEMIGWDPFIRDADLIVWVIVEADAGTDGEPGRVRATVRLVGARSGERQLEAASCRQLVDELALVIMLALVPSPPPAVKPAAVKPTVVVQVRAPDEPRRPRAPRPIWLDAIAGGATTDRLRPEVYLGVWARRGRAAAALELAAEAPRSFAEGMGQVTILRAAATLAPCVRLDPFAGCAVLSASVLRGRGEGFVEDRSAVMPLVMAGGRIAWERAITGRLRLQIRGEVGGILTTNQLLVDDKVVWSARRVEGRLGFGLLARVP